MNPKRRTLELAAASFIGLGLTSAWGYTPEQAAAGRTDFAANCSACHGENLRLLETAQLAGPAFVGRWQGRRTDELFNQLRATMPPEGPGSLGEETYLNVIAFLMESNGTQPNDQTLTASAGEVVVAAPAGSGPGGPGQAEPEPTGVIVAGTVQDFVPVTDAMLRNPSPGDWPMLRHDSSASNFSSLNQITPENAHQLQLAWIWPMRDGGTNQPSPLAYRGTIYLNNTEGVIQALNGSDGSLRGSHADVVGLFGGPQDRHQPFGKSPIANPQSG